MASDRVILISVWICIVLNVVSLLMHLTAAKDTGETVEKFRRRGNMSQKINAIHTIVTQIKNNTLWEHTKKLDLIANRVR